MIKQILFGATVILGGAAFYKYETESLEITKYEIENEKIPKEFNNFKIVQISDLHNKSFGKDNKRLLFSTFIFTFIINTHVSGILIII